MFGVDAVIFLLALIAFVFLFLLLDFLLAGGGMTSAMMGGVMQCGAAVLGSPYGWTLMVAIVLIILVLFGIFFR